MSIANKLTKIAENEQKVFDAGVKSEYDRFWDAFQSSGNRTDYQNAFYGEGWTFSNFFPKHNFVIDGSAQRMFYNFSKSRDVGSLSDRFTECGVIFDTSKATNLREIFYYASFTKVPGIDVTACPDANSCGGLFANARYLTRVDKIVVNASTVYTTWFNNCSALTEVAFEGEIGQDGLNFNWSPLSVESVKNIISHLKDFSGTDEAFTKTIQFSSDSLQLLAEEGDTSPNGNSWIQYATDKGWNI